MFLRRSIYGIQLHMPVSLLKTIFFPFWGSDKSVALGVGRYDIPSFFQNGDGQQVCNTLFVQPDLKIPIPPLGIGRHRTCITTSIHGSLTLVHIIQELLDEEGMLRSKAI